MLDKKVLKEINDLFNKTKKFREDTDIFLNLTSVLFHSTHFKAADESIASLKQLNILVDKIIECQNRPNRTGLDKAARDFKRQYQLHKDFIINHNNVIEIIFRMVFNNKHSVNKNLDIIKEKYSELDYFAFLIFTKYRNILAHSSGESFLMHTSREFCGTIVVEIIEHTYVFLRELLDDNFDILSKEYTRVSEDRQGININMSRKHQMKKVTYGKCF